MSVKIFGKLVLLQCAAILTLGAQAAQAGVNVNINLGEPPRQVIVPQPVYVAPPPVYAPPPAYAPPPVYAPPMDTIRVEDDVQFVYPDALGFYVAVGVPYDLFYLQNSYYLFRDGRWLRAPSSRGPWLEQRYRELPPGLRRYRMERIREYRTREYAVYNRDREHYRGRQWKEQHREVKERRKAEQHFEKEQRKDEKRHDKEQRKEEKRSEQEERHDHREGRGN